MHQINNNLTSNTANPIENQAIKCADNLITSVKAALHPVLKAFTGEQKLAPSGQHDCGVPVIPQSNGPFRPQHSSLSV